MTFPAATAPDTRIVPKVVLLAKEDAARIVFEAEERANEIRRAAEGSAKEAAEKARESLRSEEAARFAALCLSVERERAKASDVLTDEIASVARIVAERVLEAELRMDPSAIRALARAALSEARGFDRGMLFVHASDRDEVEKLAADLDLQGLDVSVDDTLTRGSVLVRTNVGEVDARIEVVLDRLSAALREALAETPRGG